MKLLCGCVDDIVKVFVFELLLFLFGLVCCFILNGVFDFFFFVFKVFGEKMGLFVSFVFFLINFIKFLKVIIFLDFVCVLWVCWYYFILEYEGSLLFIR